jgi:hypothetical protein
MRLSFGTRTLETLADQYHEQYKEPCSGSPSGILSDTNRNITETVVKELYMVCYYVYAPHLLTIVSFFRRTRHSILSSETCNNSVPWSHRPSRGTSIDTDTIYNDLLGTSRML